MAGLLALAGLLSVSAGACAAPWGGWEPGPAVGLDSGLCDAFAGYELTAGAVGFGGCGAVGGGGDAACIMQHGMSRVY